MLPVKRIVTLVVFSAFIISAMAQPPKTPKNNAAPKAKLPKLSSSIGIRKDSAVITADEGIQLVMLPIKVTDDKKLAYTVVNYQFLYRKKGVTEDEESGKVTPITSIVANRFKTTPLPETWTRIITEQLQPGEELLFFDIVVKDALGKLMFAPDIKLIVK